MTFFGNAKTHCEYGMLMRSRSSVMGFAAAFRRLAPALAEAALWVIAIYLLLLLRTAAVRTGEKQFAA